MHPPGPAARLFLQPLTPTAWHLLRELVARAKGQDPLAPVTVVVPSTYAGLFLRRALGRWGLANVRFLVPPRLAELLGAPALAAQGKRPLTSLLEGSAVRAAASGAQGPLAPLRDHPSLHQCLRATFRELRRAGPEVLARLSSQGGLRAQVVSLYQRFKDLTSSYYDREDLAQSAAQAVASGTAPGLADLGTVILYLVHDLTPAEMALVKDLAHSWRCDAVLGLTGDALVDGRIRSLADHLSPHLGPPQETGAALQGVDSRLVITPDAHQEARWVLRSIVRAAEEGVPFHRMAVLYRQSDPYATLVPELFRLAGIPVAGPGNLALGDTLVGRTLKELMGLPGQEFSRQAVMEWLTACPVAPPGGSRAVFSPSLWDTVSRRAGVVRGLGQWRERLAAYATRLEEEASQEEVEAIALRKGREAQAARDLASFVESLGADARPPEQGPSWRAFAQWAGRLLDRYLDRRLLSEQEQGAWEDIQRGLAEMESLDPVEPGPTFQQFALALEELLSARAGRLGKFGQGVFVAPLGAARGLEFDRIYVVGMIEGAMPPRVPDDPLVPDEARRGAGMSLKASRQTEERYDYLSALATASTRVLSYPVGDTAAQRGQFPSRWFLEEASRLQGSQVFTGDLPRLNRQPWLTMVPSREGGLRSLEQVSPADVHDYDLYHLLRWRDSGQPLGAHHLAASGHLARALALEHARRGRRLTVWDGDLSSLAGQAHRLDLFRRPVLSATALESWATCPFKYFLAEVLRLSALEEPEELETIPVLERGRLVHSILERFIRQVQVQGTLPGPAEPWREEHRELLFQTAQEAFREASQRGVTGKRLLWELAQEEILADLDRFLEEDWRLRSQFNVSPYRVELRFGFDPREVGASEAEATYLVPGLGVLRFRGIIDRVDLDPSGEKALLLDYKTGSATSYQGLTNDPVDGGRRLQLPIYALAVAQALKGRVGSVQAAYWFVGTRGGFTLVPRTPLELAAVEEHFARVVAVIAGGITRGRFPANPGRPKDSQCKHCDFDSLCPARRHFYWERKRSDPRLADYLALAGQAAKEGGET